MATMYSLCVFNVQPNCPAALHQQCFQYILMFLEQFSIRLLSLLPLRIRQQLLWNLPIADVCLLEATQFTNGMNMEDYWSMIVHTSIQDRTWHTHCLECMHENQWCSPCRWKSIVESTSAKDWVYGEVTAEAITKLRVCIEFPPYPSDNFRAFYSLTAAMMPLRNHKRDDIYAFLFALRLFSIDSDTHSHIGVACEFKFPSRYCRYAVDMSSFQRDRFYLMSPEEQKSLLDAIIHCFHGKKPCVVCTSRGLLDDLSEEGLDFFSDLKFFTCQLYEPLTEIPSLEVILKGTVSLEVLHIENCCDRFTCPSASLNGLFGHIIDLPLLDCLSTVVLSDGDHSHFELSQDILDNFMQALKSRSNDRHLSIQIDCLTLNTHTTSDYRETIYFTTYNLCKKCQDMHSSRNILFVKYF